MSASLAQLLSLRHRQALEVDEDGQLNDVQPKKAHGAVIIHPQPAIRPVQNGKAQTDLLHRHSMHAMKQSHRNINAVIIHPQLAIRPCAERQSTGSSVT